MGVLESRAANRTGHRSGLQTISNNLFHTNEDELFPPYAHEQNVALVPSIGWKVPDQVATGAFQSTERPERVDEGKERARSGTGRQGWNRTGSVIKHSFQWMTFPGFYN